MLHSTERECVKMSKMYYVGHSYMGTNFTYDSPCWCVYGFNSQQERDKWLETGYYNQDTGNIVAEAITRKDAEKILGCSIDDERVHIQQIDEHMCELSR